MKKVILLLLTVSFFLHNVNAQEDTLAVSGLLDELLQLEDQENRLLPDRLIPSQAILWGKKGLMRNFNGFELTPENREKELRIRRTMLSAHQVIGLATLGGMIAQGVVGSKLYDGDYDLIKTHQTLATGLNIGYFTTAGLSLFAPPKLIDERQGISTIKIHKALAIVHLSGMIATNILAQSIRENPDLRPWHRAAAFTTFGAYAASMIVIKF